MGVVRVNYPQQTRELRSGEYIISRGVDSEAERADCRRIMRNNGCRSIRFEVKREYSPYDDAWVNKLSAHGYLAYIQGVPEIEAL